MHNLVLKRTKIYENLIHKEASITINKVRLNSFFKCLHLKKRKSIFSFHFGSGYFQLLYADSFILLIIKKNA